MILLPLFSFFLIVVDNTNTPSPHRGAQAVQRRGHPQRAARPSALSRALTSANPEALWVDSVHCWRYVCARLKKQLIRRKGEAAARRDVKKGGGLRDPTLQQQRGSRYPCATSCVGE
eukprot:gene25771-33236_t